MSYNLYYLPVMLYYGISITILYFIWHVYLLTYIYKHIIHIRYITIYVTIIKLFEHFKNFNPYHKIQNFQFTLYLNILLSPMAI